MSLKVQTTKDHKIFNIGNDAELHYRFLAPLEQMRFMRNYTHKGKMTEDQSVQMSYDLMKKMVINWKGVVNETDDKPIKFKPELIEILPMPVILNFITLIITPLFVGIIDTAKTIKIKKGEKQKESNLGN